MLYSFEIALTLMWVAAALPVAAAAATDKAVEAKAPPLPILRSLWLEPDSLKLHDGRDERRVLVFGKTDDGKQIDLTSEAVFKSESTNVEVAAQGYLRARNKGAAEVTVFAAGLEAKLPVTVENAARPEIRFVRDIAPVLSKVGCNAGTCHGSAKGKNGFKLSLRGYDPEFDYQALINDLSGRRFNRVVVDDSLMLQKPTGEVPHEGRQTIKPGSREYQLLRSWIAEGTKFEGAEAGRPKKLELFPATVEMDLAGRSQQIMVIARYDDGTTRDVTRDAVFSVSNTEVAEVKDGVVKGLRRGEAAVLVRYEGLYSTKLMTVMGDRAGYQWVETPEYNYIDQHVYAKLRLMKILPSDLCTDAEFIRRVSLDLTSLPPQVDRLRAFLADPAPSRTKREALVDQLLASSEYVDNWANKWADLLQCSSETLGQKGVFIFRDWIKRTVAENKPYDQFVRELLTAQGSCYQNPAVNYLRVLREPGKMTEDVSQTFLGVRFNCNKCHDHPFEKWTQNQYYEFGAYFARVAIKRGTLGREVIRNNTGDASPVVGEEIVYRSYNGGEVRHLKTDKEMKPKVPFGTARDAKPDEDRRDAFVDWLTSKDNPLFAKSMANRTWSYFFGRGIIEPVDDIRASNPPSNPALLEALSEDFIAGGFDRKKLIRTICRSRTYQLSIVKNKWNEEDKINFAGAQPRRLSAEQLLDAVTIATGARPDFAGLPVGMRAVEVPDASVAGNDFLALFGRPKRQTACECERSSNITLSHALNMINGTMLGDAISSPTNYIAKVVETEKDDKKVVEDIYLACLNRPPTEKELAAIDLTKASRLEIAQDLAWALLNSPAFLFNR